MPLRAHGVAGLSVADTTTELEVLTVGGFQRLPQGGDLLAVTPLEVGELACRRADDTTGLVGIDSGLRGRCGGPLLVAELLDATPQVGVTVEKVEGDTCDLSECPESDPITSADHVAQPLLGSLNGGGLLGRGGSA
ncbi:hypothetical protein GCM10022224_034480 [Nonomuraea antimicrobica]|uniref:Uncharacterized protein n=1 Tax=Nonomuraea antimicrobica TaxID=561173 RepID=A0ABP7BTJ8_9ACTN